MPNPLSSVRGRFAVASMAVIGPLMAASVAGAATGESPIGSPTELLQSAVASVGIGGSSGEVRRDYDARAGAAGDLGQPGSRPGNTANAPGLGGSNESRAPKGHKPGGDQAAALAEETPDDPRGEKLAPHKNGKGCDDVLFAMGEPPFASPGGPVGCEAGNSGEHRKNGKDKAKPAAEDESDEGEEEEDTEDDDEGDSNGGVSRGLGRGHDEDNPGNGNGNGHDKHGHEPNTNGNGPPDRDEEEGDEDAPTPPEPAAGGATPLPAEPSANNGRGNGKAKGNGNTRNR